MSEVKKTCKNCGYRDEINGTCLLEKACIDANHENSYLFWIDEKALIERGIVIHPETLKRVREAMNQEPPRLLTLEEVRELKPDDDIFVEVYNKPFVAADTVRNNMGTLISCMSGLNIIPDADNYLHYLRLWTRRPDKTTQLTTKWEGPDE